MQTFKIFFVLTSLPLTFSAASFANRETCRLITEGSIFALNNYVTDNRLSYEDFVAPDQYGRTPADLAEATGNADMIQMVNDIEIELRDLEPREHQFKFEEEVAMENGNPNFFASIASPRGF